MPTSNLLLVVTRVPGMLNDEFIAYKFLAISRLRYQIHYLYSNIYWALSLFTERHLYHSLQK